MICSCFCLYIFFHSFSCFFFFFFNDTATTEIYTLSLHDALPISPADASPGPWPPPTPGVPRGDRKSTRLNSSHTVISYAVFCLKKKKKNINKITINKKKNTKIIKTIIKFYI